MVRGGINHLALTVSDLARLAWASPNGSVTMRPAKAESAHKVHDRNAPGLNHMAFAVGSRTGVDEVHEKLKEMSAQILDAPAEYSYFPVYFTDPDGLKLGICVLAATIAISGVKGNGNCYD